MGGGNGFVGKGPLIRDVGIGVVIGREALLMGGGGSFTIAGEFDGGMVNGVVEGCFSVE